MLWPETKWTHKGSGHVVRDRCTVLVEAKPAIIMCSWEGHLMRDSQLFGHVSKRKGRVEKFIRPTVLVYLGINWRNEFL